MRQIMKAYGEPEVRLQSRLTLALGARKRPGSHSGSFIAQTEGDAHCVGDWPSLGQVSGLYVSCNSTTTGTKPRLSCRPECTLSALLTELSQRSYRERIYKRVLKIAKSDYYLYVCPSVRMNNSAPTTRILMKLDI